MNTGRETASGANEAACLHQLLDEETDGERTSTQVPYHERRIVARWWDNRQGYPSGQAAIGGGFGGKQGNPTGGPVRALTKATGCRCVWSIVGGRSSLRAQRHPQIIKFRDGVKGDTVTAVELPCLVKRERIPPTA